MKKLSVLIAMLAVTSGGSSAQDNWDDTPFIGEVRWWAGNFEPRDWKFCDGQFLSINYFPTLYTVIGSAFGGDGISTFALPDVRGRVIIHGGSGGRVTDRTRGTRVGVEKSKMTIDQLPPHNHAVNVFATESGVDTHDPKYGFLASARIYTDSGSGDAQFNESAIAEIEVGDDEPRSNMQPSLVLNCIIAVDGVFPPRQ